MKCNGSCRYNVRGKCKHREPIMEEQYLTPELREPEPYVVCTSVHPFTMYEIHRIKEHQAKRKRELAEELIAKAKTVVCICGAVGMYPVYEHIWEVMPIGFRCIKCQHQVGIQEVME